MNAVTDPSPPDALAPVNPVVTPPTAAIESMPTVTKATEAPEPAADPVAPAEFLAAIRLASHPWAPNFLEALQTDRGRSETLLRGYADCARDAEAAAAAERELMQRQTDAFIAGRPLAADEADQLGRVRSRRIRSADRFRDEEESLRTVLFHLPVEPEIAPEFLPPGSVAPENETELAEIRRLLGEGMTRAELAALYDAELVKSVCGPMPEGSSAGGPEVIDSREPTEAVETVIHEGTEPAAAYDSYSHSLYAGRSVANDEARIVNLAAAYTESAHAEIYLADALAAFDGKSGSFLAYLRDPARLESAALEGALARRRDEIMELTHPFAVKPGATETLLSDRIQQMRRAESAGWRAELAGRDPAERLPADEVRNLARLLSLGEAAQPGGCLIDARGFDIKNLAKIPEDPAAPLAFKTRGNLIDFERSCRETINYAESNGRAQMGALRAAIVGTEGAMGSALQRAYALCAEAAGETKLPIEERKRLERETNLLLGSGLLPTIAGTRDGGKEMVTDAVGRSVIGEDIGGALGAIRGLAENREAWTSVNLQAAALLAPERAGFFAAFHQDKSKVSAFLPQEIDLMRKFGPGFTAAYKSMDGPVRKAFWQEVQSITAAAPDTARTFRLFLATARTVAGEGRKTAIEAVKLDEGARREALENNADRVEKRLKHEKERIKVQEKERHRNLDRTRREIVDTADRRIKDVTDLLKADLGKGELQL